MGCHGNHAIVFGASGLVGWSIVEQLLLNYGGVGAFSRVTAVVNRPLTVEESGWPTTGIDNGTANGESFPVFNLVSGIDLTCDAVFELATQLEECVPHADSVTHIFHFAFRPDPTGDEKAEAVTNHGMLRRVILAFEFLTAEAGGKLNMVLVAGGTRGYGIYAGGDFYPSPFTEDADRMKLPEEIRESIHYFANEDFLTEHSRGKSWSWSELHFDAVIGFSPNGSAYNLTAHWGTYLSLYAAAEGAGAQIPFPGTEDVYRSFNNEASADMIGRMAVWAALHPGRTGGQVFNIADQETAMSYVERWPHLAAFFGLVGVPPDPEWDAGTYPRVGAYIEKHAHLLKERGVKPNVVFGGSHLNNYGGAYPFNRILSLNKARAAGFVEERDPVEGWHRAWSKFRDAGLLLPKQ